MGEVRGIDSLRSPLLSAAALRGRTRLYWYRGFEYVFFSTVPWIRIRLFLL